MTGGFPHFLKPCLHTENFEEFPLWLEWVKNLTAVWVAVEVQVSPPAQHTGLKDPA